MKISKIGKIDDRDFGSLWVDLEIVPVPFDKNDPQGFPGGPIRMDVFVDLNAPKATSQIPDFVAHRVFRELAILSRDLTQQFPIRIIYMPGSSAQGLWPARELGEFAETMSKNHEVMERPDSG